MGVISFQTVKYIGRRPPILLCKQGQRACRGIWSIHFRPYQGAKKGKQIASSTKWKLRENVVLRLMECLTSAFSFDIFMDNSFTSFLLLTHLGVNNIHATAVLNKNRLPKCTGDKKLQKRWPEFGQFEQCTYR